MFTKGKGKGKGEKKSLYNDWLKKSKGGSQALYFHLVKPPNEEENQPTPR